MYVVALAVCNAIYQFSPMMDLLSNVHGRWWMGKPLCDLHNYLTSVGSASQICIHVSISVNRLWAVHSPISYRQHHNRKVALLICFAAVLFAHLIELPGCVLDALYYSIDYLEHGCHVDYMKQILWSHFDFALHALTLMFIIVAYVHLCINRWKRHRKNAVYTSGNESGASDRQNTRKEASKPFLVLSLTAVSCFIFWTPGIVSFGTIKYSGKWIPENVLSVAMTMYSIQAIFDPWLFAFSVLATKKKWSLAGFGK
ncbi:tyramine receptor Ser-2-like [Paramacrobiotus metropolitanus]|uniref:tyramine receptor Ser-2-like n=1 Tax=Paramacrobiotus metropolitanus TaxID=2943436 RepID=UPI002446283C|nr:tyramine receptor Ser-2-like [Paramacrobiotus metropolitanus]